MQIFFVAIAHEVLPILFHCGLIQLVVWLIPLSFLVDPNRQDWSHNLWWWSNLGWYRLTWGAVTKAVGQLVVKSFCGRWTSSEATLIWICLGCASSLILLAFDWADAKFDGNWGSTHFVRLFSFFWVKPNDITERWGWSVILIPENERGSERSGWLSMWPGWTTLPLPPAARFNCFCRGGVLRGAFLPVLGIDVCSDSADGCSAHDEWDESL